MIAGLLSQPRPQANSRYSSDRRGFGTERGSKKAWHKMAKKKTDIAQRKSPFCKDQGIFRNVVAVFFLAEVGHLASPCHFGFARHPRQVLPTSFTADITSKLARDKAVTSQH